MIREWLAKTIAGDKLISLDLPRPVKSFTGWIPQHDSMGGGLLPQTNYDYQAAVGDGLGSSVLMSPIKWIQRTFPEAPLTVIKEDDEGGTPVFDHAMVKAIEQPNPFYSGIDLFQGTLYSFVVDGNAYWQKVRGSTRGVMELWYRPHWLMEPKWVGNDFISYYQYKPSGSGVPIHLMPEDVIHFRNGINPRNTRKGMSLIYSELREIFGDDEAANLIASLMKNMGVPGLMLSPEGDAVLENVSEVKAYLKQQFVRDKRGEPYVSAIAAKLHQFGFDPKQMDMSSLRDIAEERICAALGVRASVVGFGSGLQTTKVGATLAEDVRMSWNACIVPMQRSFSLKLEQSLLPEFESKPESMRVEFDLSEVEALKESRKLTAEAMQIGVAGGWIRVSEARDAMGLEWDETDEIYLRGLNMIPELAGAPAEPRLLPVPPLVGPKRLKEPSAREARVIASSPDGTPTREQRALMRRFVRDALDLELDMDADLVQFFAKMGAVYAELALDILEGRKSSIEDEVLVDRIMREIDDGGLREEITDIGRSHYLRVTKRTYEAINTVVGLAVDLPDFRAREIMALGGRRMGLVDLSDSVRKRLFRELTEGRSLGEGPVELARRIREKVPAGHWSSPKVRARVIARTETLHAQRTSALEAYKDAPNVSSVMVFDNRTGYDDEECAALDGKIVDLADAWDLMNEEHVNGTRAFAPVVN